MDNCNNNHQKGQTHLFCFIWTETIGFFICITDYLTVILRLFDFFFIACTTQKINWIENRKILLWCLVEMIQCIGTCISTSNCKRNHRSFIVICAEIGWISFLRGYLWYADRLDVGQSPKFLSVSHWDTFSESLSPPFAEVKLRLWPHLSKLTLRRRITYDGHKFPFNGPLTMVHGWKPSVVPDPWRKQSIDSFTEPR